MNYREYCAYKIIGFTLGRFSNNDWWFLDGHQFIICRHFNPEELEASAWMVFEKLVMKYGITSYISKGGYICVCTYERPHYVGYGNTLMEALKEYVVKLMENENGG